MDFVKRYLMYEANKNPQYIDYAEVTHIINDKLVNVNMGGQRNQDGSLVILEAVAIEGDYVPKIGDWVGVEWRNGQPVVVGGEAANSGLSNINNSVKIVSSTDITGNIINTDHLKTNIIEARHIKANQIEGTHIKAETIDSVNIKAGAITSEKISAESIEANHFAVSSKQFGLYGQYYAGQFAEYKGFRIDSEINFDWLDGSPSIVGQADNFSIIWEGFLFSDQIGPYVFFATIGADDKIRVYLDGNLILDGWNSSIDLQATVSLEKDKWYTIKVEYVELTGNASVKLEWQQPSGVRKVIPSRYLSPNQTTIDGSSIMTGSITANNIKTGTITATSGILADASITTAHIQDGSITNAKIANAEITGAKIANATITNANIADATIESAKIKSIDAQTITVGTLDANRIGAQTITANHIKTGTITGDKIAVNTIIGDNLISGTITAREIAGGTITAAQIQAGSITGNEIKVGTITSQHITTGGLDANIISVYNATTGEVLVGGGYIRVDGFDVGVVQSDNLVSNGEFLVTSSSWGLRRENIEGESVLGGDSNASGGHTIWKYDMTTTPSPTLVSNNILAGKKPAFIEITANNAIAYVSNQGDNTVSKIDLVNNVEISKISVGKEPTILKLTNDEKYLLVANTDLSNQTEPDSVIIIDTTTFTEYKKIIVGSSPFDIAITNNYAYVPCAIPGDIYVIDLQTFKVVRTIYVGANNYPVSNALSPDESYLFVTNGLSDKVVKYDIATGLPLAETSMGDALTIIVAHPTNGKLYVASPGSNEIYIVDQNTLQILNVIKQAEMIKPLYLVVTPSTTQNPQGLLYISASATPAIFIMDIATEQIIGYLNAGANVMGMHFSSDYQYLYIANNGDSSFISFIYPAGDFIGDAYIGGDGAVKYHGADYWMPNRTDRVYDANGNLVGASSVEFHVGEPKNNEAGYAQLMVAGAVSQKASIEQDIAYVTNYSDGTASEYTHYRHHNASILIHKEDLKENPAGTGTIETKFEVDELVPKFVVIEDTQTTPIPQATLQANGIDPTKYFYNGLVLSATTNRALKIPIEQIQVLSDGVPIDIIATYGDNPNTTSDISRVFDGNTDTNIYFYAGNTTKAIVADLGRIYIINELKIWHYYKDSRKYNTKLEVSYDGQNWIVLYDSSVVGTYVETPEGKTYNLTQIFGGSQPIRFIKDTLQGNTVNDGNHWVDIQAFGDWEVETGTLITLPDGSQQGSYSLALASVNSRTNGTVVTTTVSDAYIDYTIDIEFLSDWYFTYLTGTEFGVVRLLVDDMSPEQVDGTKHLYVFQNSNITEAKYYAGIKLKPGTHTIRIQQSSGKVNFDRFRFEDFQHYYTWSTLVPHSDSPNWDRIKIIPSYAKNYVGIGLQSTVGAFDTPRPDGSSALKYRLRVSEVLSAPTVPDGNYRGIAYVTGALFETGKLHTSWRASQISENFPAEKIEPWNPDKPITTGIQSKHIADGAIHSTKILSHSLMDWHISPYAQIAEFKLDLNHPTHPHSNKTVLDKISYTGTKSTIDLKGIEDNTNAILGKQDALGFIPVNKTGDVMTGNLTIENTGGTQFWLKSDLNNLGGTNNPLIKLSQGGNSKWLEIGIDSNNKSFLSAYDSSTSTNADIYIKNHYINNNAYKIFHEGNFTPSNYYTKAEADILINAYKDAENNFTATNTFSKAGLALKIQPSTAVADNVSLFKINYDATTNLLDFQKITVAGGAQGKLIINGNLQVTGETVYSQAQDVQGDMSVDGNLTVHGSVVLGDAPTDTTTINGNLTVNGQIVETGKLREVVRFPIYGIGGDAQFQTDSNTLEEIVRHYSTFYNGGSSALPSVPTGATRKFKLLISYSIANSDFSATLSIMQWDDVTQIQSFVLPSVLGADTGIVRTLLTPEFTTTYTGHTIFKAKANNTGTTLVIKYIELIAYDVY